MPTAPTPLPVAALLLAACQVAPVPTPLRLDDDGGWCWFQGERAVALGEVIVVGSVAAGVHDPARRGDVQLTYWWPATGEVRRVELADRLELDDHDAPALLELDDGRLLAVYAKHGTDHQVRWRRTERPGDLLAWEAERSFAPTPDARLGVTYSNLCRGKNGELLDFFRGLDWDPNLIASTDDAASFEWRGRVLGGEGRPYVRYRGDGEGRVHLIATEQHPRDFDNGLYHGVVDGLDVRASDGALLGRVGDDPPAPDALTRVFPGRPDAVAWPVDLELDGEGRPVALFSIQVDGAGRPPGTGGLDHRYLWARFDGERWRVEPLAFAGSRLYAGEDDYTGLAALDPADPTVAYLSTDADPATGAPLVCPEDGARHRRLFRAERRAGGGFAFEPLAKGSHTDDLRPIVPRGSPRVLLWLRGEYRSYTDYSLEVWGLRLTPRSSPPTRG